MKNRPSHAALGLCATTAEVDLGGWATAADLGGAAASFLAGCFSVFAGNLSTTGLAAFDAAITGRTALAGCGGTAADTAALDALVAATATGTAGLDAGADAGISGAAVCIAIPGG